MGLIRREGRTRVSGISVIFESVFASCDGKVCFGDDLIECVGATAEGFAGIAVAIGEIDGQWMLCYEEGGLGWEGEGGWGWHTRGCERSGQA